MSRTRILQTESFRFAALFAALFVSSALVLGIVVYWTVNWAVRAELVDAIDEDVGDVQRGYATLGLKEAIEIVGQRLAAPAGTDYSLLQDRTGRRLAGNLPPMAPRLGLVELPSPFPRERGKRGEHTVLGRGIMLADGLYFFAGEDTYVLTEALHSVIAAVGWVLGAAAILAIGGGVLLSRGFLRRVNAITATCQSVIEGRLAERIPTRGTYNELDRLATIVNGMLDHIVTLMDSLRQVSSDIAHDLRTPLSHLRQRLEAARARAHTLDDYAAAVDRAIADADELLEIFAALLRISNIESGTRRAALVPVDLSELLARLAETYVAVAEDRGQILRARIAPKIGVRADSALLVQMFANLIENAIRHTPKGTTIRLELDAGENEAVATVADNGPGIPAAERDKVFRRFYRLEADRGSPGHGLGLSLAAAIADLHRVRIALSDNAPGLRVTVRLPLDRAALPPAAPEARGG